MLINLVFNLINLLFFLNDFLPFRFNSHNSSDVEITRNFSSSNKSFDRYVIMVVDALRLDFLNEKNMPLTSSLIENYGCLMSVKVNSPTVTLPRIKALTTGSVPQFVDIFYNLGNPDHVGDSVLHRARKQNMKLIFYGDDTWLKVFPEMFLRHEGTTSFFVNDFYEVDVNVTKNVNVELKNEDWDIMILHYLGLDHIGHVYGPFSPIVPAKLQEMDEIFFRLFQETYKKKGKSLLLLTGDHGMKDSGGHGGSTYSETHVPLAILGTSCGNGSIDQVDIAPNLAALMNLEIPSTSVGKINRNFLLNFTIDQYLDALRYNSEILKTKGITWSNKCELASNSHELYLKSHKTPSALKAIELYEECSKQISDVLVNATIRQNIPSMAISVIFMIFSLIISLNDFIVFEKRSHSYLFYTVLLIIRIVSHEYFALFVGISVVSVQLFRVLKIHNILENLKNVLNIPVMLILVQPLTWFASSFIEEEQQYWYFFLNSFIIFQCMKHMKNRNNDSFSSWLIISLLFRFAQTMNQTGDRWAAQPDTADFLMKSDNYPFHITLLCISVFGIYHFCYRNCNNLQYSLLTKFILILIFSMKLNIFDEIHSVRIIYILIFVSVIIGKNVFDCWIFIISLLSKSYNLCFIPMCVYLSHEIVLEFEVGISSIALHLVLGKSLFFMQGNGNSLASVDVTVGYLGLKSFQPILVSIQILVSVYSYIILIHILSMKSRPSGRMNVFKILYGERTYSMIVACIVIIIFRNHISIWTIYASKLFIEFSHTMVLFVEIIIYQITSYVSHNKSLSSNIFSINY